MNDLTLKDIVKIVLKKIWLVVLLPFVAIVIATVIVYFIMTPVYTASATMYVLNRQNASSETVTSADLQSSQLLTADYRELILSKRVLSAVEEKFSLEAGSLKDVQVSSVNNTRWIQISVTSPNPILAANLANAVGQEFSVTVVQIMDVNNVSIVDAAVPPVEPSAPRKLQTIAIAAAAAFMLAVGIIILIEMFNTTIRTSDDVENALGLTVLARVPKVEVKQQ